MSVPGSVAAVVLAAGSGTRVGADRNKAYIRLGGRCLLSWSLDTLARLPELRRLVLVVRADERALAAETVEREVSGVDVELVDGGLTRHGSEQAALDHLRASIESGEIDLVLIHDAARPLATLALARAVLAGAREYGGALPGLPDDDLAEIDANGCLKRDAQPDMLVRVQTPQAFGATALLDAYAKASADGFEGSDTSATLERYSDVVVCCVAGDPRNLKVTYPHDLSLAERLLTAASDDEPT